MAATRACAGHRPRAARAGGLAAAELPRAVRAVRGGRLPDAVRQVRALLRAGCAATGTTRCRATIPPHEGAAARAGAALPAAAGLAGRAPLPELDLQPHRAETGGSRTGRRSSCTPGRGRARDRGRRPGQGFNDRGEARFWARVGETVAPGVAAHSSLWWLRDSPAGRNVNALTSDRLSDMGGGATFHDNLVEVEREERSDG